MEIKTITEKVKIVTEVDRKVNQFILNEEEIKAVFLLIGCMPVVEIEKFLTKTVDFYKKTNSPISNNFDKEKSKEILDSIFTKVCDEFRKNGNVINIKYYGN